MMKCPKCQFEQPPDTYCANCGVNMSIYRPDPKPMFMRLATHWMFHLSVLIALIIGLVMYDRERPEKIQQQNRAMETLPQPQNLDSPSPEEPEPAMPVAQKLEAPASAPTAEAPVEETETAAAVEVKGAKSNLPRPLKAQKKSIRVAFYQASKSAIGDIQRDSQASNLNNDASGGIINLKKVAQLRDSGELKPLSANNYKDFDSQHPIMVFKGQRSPTGKNIGLFFQITPMKEDAGSLQVELKSWGNLKVQGAEENLFVSEMVITPQAGAYIAGFLPKDKTFNDEEKMVFESDRTLKLYNMEEFWDGSADLILLVELVNPA